MTRKQLPKAINRTGDNVHAFAGSIVPDEVAPEPAPLPAPAFNKIADEPVLAVSSAPIANDSAPAARARSRPRALPDQMAAKRRCFARKIIERHRTYAAVGGLMPLAVVNIASVTAVNLRMVRQLSELYQVPFQRDRARAAIVSLIGGAAPSGFGLATSSTLMWIVPGGVLVGLGVSALAAGALTRAIGQVFVEGFENSALARDEA
ncbi:MAG: YcjF family protein [Xanthobacteraceae bacterium]